MLHRSHITFRPNRYSHSRPRRHTSELHIPEGEAHLTSWNDRTSPAPLHLKSGSEKKRKWKWLFLESYYLRKCYLRWKKKEKSTIYWRNGENRIPGGFVTAIAYQKENTSEINEIKEKKNRKWRKAMAKKSAKKTSAKWNTWKMKWRRRKHQSKKWHEENREIEKSWKAK